MGNCKVCGCNQWETAYTGSIRLGDLNNLSNEDFTVFRCRQCSVQWLPGLVEDATSYYESDSYRNDVGETTSIHEYRKMHDPEIKYMLDLLPVENYRNKIVADIGCGGGTFLDAIKGIAGKTIAVEPNVDLLKQVGQNGHVCYPNMDELLAGEKEPAGMVVSFQVIEHVDDPLNFVRSIKAALGKDGIAILSTPNSNDFLLRHGPGEYRSFFYRKVHQWYFDAQSLLTLMRHGGFANVEIRYQHIYGLSNALLWMRDKKGPGRNEILNDPTCEFAWAKFLNNSGQASRIICIAS